MSSQAIIAIGLGRDFSHSVSPWTAEEVDAQLKQMMKRIHDASAEAAAEYGLGYNLVAGANIAGFKKVATAMMEQGVF